MLFAGGTVACWGVNDLGQLGDGSTTGPENCLDIGSCSTTPGVVSGVSGATAVATNGSEACAVLSSGAVECWGSNADGELGNATVATVAGNPVSPVPSMVAGLTRATAVAVGLNYGLRVVARRHRPVLGVQRLRPAGQRVDHGFDDARPRAGRHRRRGHRRGRVPRLRADGGWNRRVLGPNDSGQLGLGTSSGPQTCQGEPCATTPVKVTDLSGVTAIAAGDDDTCALISDGTVRCWGWNTDGELGDGTTMHSSTPVVVSGLSGASAIAMGDTPRARSSRAATSCAGATTTPASWQVRLRVRRRATTPVFDHAAEHLRVVTLRPSEAGHRRMVWRLRFPAMVHRSLTTRSGSGVQVLVVDDDEDFREACAGVLESDGYEVQRAASAAEAIERAAAWRPRVVVTDLEMPGMSGIELCEYFLHEYAPPAPGVVVVSGVEAAGPEALRKGARAFLSKPYGPDELLVVMRAALEGRPGQAETEPFTNDKARERAAARAMAEAALGSAIATGPVSRQSAIHCARWLGGFYRPATAAMLFPLDGKLDIYASSDPEHVAGGQPPVALKSIAETVLETGSTLIVQDIAVQPWLGALSR